MEVFENEAHKIILGDCVEVLSDYIQDGTIDLIFADPPYNIGKNFNGRKDKWESDEAYLRWCYVWLDLCVRKLKPDGSFYVMTATQFMPYFDIYLRSRLSIISRIVWYYDSSGVQAKRRFGSMYEPILHCVKRADDYRFNTDQILVSAKTGAIRKLVDYRKKMPTIYNTTKVPGNVWEFPRVRYRMPEFENHPTQKPLVLLERIIKASSNEGDLILDPFAGTFTTCDVARRLNRRSIGIEIDENYVKIGLRRMEMLERYNNEVLTKPVKSFCRRATSQGRLPLD